MSMELWVALGFVSLIYVGLWATGKWLLPRFKIGNPIADMNEAELKSHIADLVRRLDESDAENKKLQGTVNFLLGEMDKKSVEIGKQKEEIGKLSGRVKELEDATPKAAQVAPTTPKSRAGRVLGVWPTPLPLDTIGEKDAIYSTGLEYESLEGAAATRMGIVEQLGQRSDYRIMEIGAKGGETGIQLHDGITPPLWWSQLAKQHNIDIFVVLSNESSKPGVTNVADALFNAGAKAVISVDSSIDDLDAVKFARVLYRRLAKGMELAEAVGIARLAISDQGSDTIKLREKQ